MPSRVEILPRLSPFGCTIKWYNAAAESVFVATSTAAKVAAVGSEKSWMASATGGTARVTAVAAPHNDPNNCGKQVGGGGGAGGEGEGDEDMVRKVNHTTGVNFNWSGIGKPDPETWRL